MAAKKSQREANKDKKATLIQKAKAYEKEYKEAELADIKAVREVTALVIPGQSQWTVLCSSRSQNRLGRQNQRYQQAPPRCQEDLETFEIATTPQCRLHQDQRRHHENAQES